MILDGARGVILEMFGGLCHIVWEDYFASWEKEEVLEKAAE